MAITTLRLEDLSQNSRLLFLVAGIVVRGNRKCWKPGDGKALWVAVLMWHVLMIN